MPYRELKTWNGVKRQFLRWISGFVIVATGIVVIMSLGFHLPKWFKTYVEWFLPEETKGDARVKAR